MRNLKISALVLRRAPAPIFEGLAGHARSSRRRHPSYVGSPAPIAAITRNPASTWRRSAPAPVPPDRSVNHKVGQCESCARHPESPGHTLDLRRTRLPPVRGGASSASRACDEDMIANAAVQCTRFPRWASEHPRHTSLVSRVRGLIACFRFTVSPSARGPTVIPLQCRGNPCQATHLHTIRLHPAPFDHRDQVDWARIRSGATLNQDFS